MECSFIIWTTIAFFALSSRAVEIPRISLSELESLKDPEEALRLLGDDGGRIGAFYVSGTVNNLTDFLSAAPPCIGGNPELPSLSLRDGSVRKTFATADSEVFPVCMGKSLSALVESYDRIELAMVALLKAFLDGAALEFSSYSSQGERFILPLKESPAKDHIHVYTRPPGNESTSKESKPSMLPFHVDNGLFLILSPFPGHGLDIKSSKGTPLSTAADILHGDLIVLVCRGLTDWFLQRSKAVRRQFHPVPHAVPPFAADGARERSVYARMKVVPLDALPLIGGMVRGKKPFQYVFENSDTHESVESICSIDLDDDELDEDASGRNSWLRMMDKQCSAGEAYCWMSCRPFRPKCASLQDSICYSTLRNLSCSTQINGLPMDQSCRWECKADILPSARRSLHQPNPYCTGKMDMYMSGFEVQGSAGGANPCIVLFIESWTLDSRLKFCFGCIGVFLLGFTIEALISLRRKVSSGCRRIISLTGSNRKVKKAALICTFGLNLALGYLAMLVAMTYSVELFCCVLFGLIMGHAVFNVDFGVSESVDPCCSGGNESAGYQRERSSRDAYAFSQAPCEGARASVNTSTPSEEDNGSIIPCCSERQSILRTDESQGDMIA
eukprot:TRINITY_DN3239_c0_g2_i1.p1 TRINITY_DN3239_c0_g2~~TRINITY_DN3239_c0_g2_i1.p1  ORF type:complete len:615 (-),score=139.56 TRINITY_DN3239_c0_g2_i1:296-2140(-)